jgi:hypothetical protein
VVPQTRRMGSISFLMAGLLRDVLQNGSHVVGG